MVRLSADIVFLVKNRHDVLPITSLSWWILEKETRVEIDASARDPKKTTKNGLRLWLPEVL
jgi:hypothetical protein